MKRTLYYAVSGTGQGCIFTSVPERDEVRKVWRGEIIGSITSFVMMLESEGLGLPPIKWNDEPVRIEIDINVFQRV